MTHPIDHIDPHLAPTGVILSAHRASSPWGPAARKPRGAKGAGLKFEASFFKELHALDDRAEHNPWFRYEGARRSGFCSPDVLSAEGGEAFIFECKLTNVVQALAQLQGLYFPVVSLALRAKPYGVIVSRHLTQTQGLSIPIVADLREALKIARGGQIPVLHWLGRAPLL